MQNKTLTSLADTRKLAEQICQLFVENNYAQGFLLVKQYWPLPVQEIDDLALQTAMQRPMIESRFGQVTGMEMVREERIGQSFVRYYFLQKFSKHAIFWRFSFYRPDLVWQINGVTFQDDLEPLYSVVQNEWQ